jgi:hypothetical protein
MGLKIAPDRLDFIEAGGVFRQPIDGEPVCAGARAASERLLVWIGPWSSTSTIGLACRPGCATGEPYLRARQAPPRSWSWSNQLVQPASEKRGGAGSALAAIHVKSARANRPARCSSLAVTGDFPAMPFGAGSEPQKAYPLVSQTESAQVRGFVRSDQGFSLGFA